jgi:hypothetical protein
MPRIAMTCSFEDVRDNAAKNYWNEMRSIKCDDTGFYEVLFCF